MESFYNTTVLLVWGSPWLVVLARQKYMFTASLYRMFLSGICRWKSLQVLCASWLQNWTWFCLVHRCLWFLSAIPPSGIVTAVSGCRRCGTEPWTTDWYVCHSPDLFNQWSWTTHVRSIVLLNEYLMVSVYLDMFNATNFCSCSYFSHSIKDH